MKCIRCSYLNLVIIPLNNDWQKIILSFRIGRVVFKLQLFLITTKKQFSQNMTLHVHCSICLRGSWWECTVATILWLINRAFASRKRDFIVEILRHRNQRMNTLLDRYRVPVNIVHQITTNYYILVCLFVF